MIGINKVLRKNLSNVLKILALVGREHGLTKPMVASLVAIYAASEGRSHFEATYLDLYPFFPASGQEKELHELPKVDTRRKYVYRHLKKVEEHQTRFGVVYYERYCLNGKCCFDVTNLKEIIEINNFASFRGLKNRYR